MGCYVLLVLVFMTLIEELTVFFLCAAELFQWVSGYSGSGGSNALFLNNVLICLNWRNPAECSTRLFISCTYNLLSVFLPGDIYHPAKNEAELSSINNTKWNCHFYSWSGITHKTKHINKRKWIRGNAAHYPIEGISLALAQMPSD